MSSSRDHARTTCFALEALRLMFGPSKFAREIATSLVEQPEEWDVSSRYVWKHVSGLSIWIANDDYGIGVGQDDVKPHDSGLPMRDRKHIWRAVRKHRGERMAAQLRGAAKQFRAGPPAPVQPTLTVEHIRDVVKAELEAREPVCRMPRPKVGVKAARAGTRVAAQVERESSRDELLNPPSEGTN